MMNSAGFCVFLAVVLWSIVAYHAQQTKTFYETNSRVSVDGHPIWGGDMVVTKEEFALLAMGLDLRTARKDRRSRWPQGNIPFIISPELENGRANIYKGLSMWNDETCVNFYEVPSISPQVAHLVLKKTGTGCNSWVGIYNTTSTKQIVSLDDGCHESVPAVAHELGHALGLWHEQDRPDRGSHLTMYTKNMDPANRVYFNNPESDVDTYGLPYDYSSLMQYNAYGFSANGRMTLVPKDPLAEAVMSYAKQPSFRDYKLVNLMYDCTSQCSNVRCSNGGYAASNSKKKCRCMCPPGFSGASCDTKLPAEPTCIQKITSPGTIRSPNYPGVMPAHSHCAWLINAPANKKIQVKFNTFQLIGRSEQRSCAWDTLRVRKNDLQSDDPGIIYCDYELKGQTLSANKEMLLVLTTAQYDDYAHGFEAIVSFV